MARLPKGRELLEKAQAQIAKATDADELRTYQAVLFPLVNRMSTRETAVAVGRSPRWVTKARNAFIQHGGIYKKPVKGGRMRSNLSLEDERAFLAPFFASASQGGILIVGVIHQALEEVLGRKVALASAYNLLHRHGWRKLAPDKRNIASDADAQEEWKKNCLSASRRSKTSGADPARSD